LGTVYAGAADAAPAATALAVAVADENEVVRRNAALSLARVAHGAGAAADQVAAALAGGLTDESHYVRGYAVLGLRRLGTPRAHGELLSYLESTRWDSSQYRA
jgi:HEAT repeat protein